MSSLVVVQAAVRVSFRLNFPFDSRSHFALPLHPTDAVKPYIHALPATPSGCRTLFTGVFSEISFKPPHPQVEVGSLHSLFCRLYVTPATLYYSLVRCVPVAAVAVPSGAVSFYLFPFKIKTKAVKRKRTYT